MTLRSAGFCLLAFLILWSCAQQSTPTGGPKDVSPPRLINSTPDSSQRSFRGKTIELTFDELIQLNNPKEEIIITPSLGKKTQFKLKDNRVVIEPELPFRENTTYTLNFREGIRDATEANVAEDLRLAFSTGPDLDTLIIAGAIKSALSEKIPENITVAIYSADTFNIFQHSPEYFTKTSKTGTFQITNLKAGTYRIYAFEDRNKNLKVESQTEQFGFLSAPVTLQKNLSRLSISLARVDSRPLKLASVRTQSNVNTIRFNKPVVKYQIIANQPILSTYGSPNQAELIAYHPEPPESKRVDSLAVQLVAVDSVDQQIDTTIFIHKNARDKIEESFRTSMTEPTFNAESEELDFKITFNKPLKAFVKDSAYLLSDSTTIIPINLATARIDTAHNELIFHQKLQLRDSLIAPALQLGKGALISIDNDSTVSVTRDITVLNQHTTGSLLVHVETKQKNYIVQVLDQEGRVIATAVNTPKPVFHYLKPQTLKVRVIVDANGNGKWDTINYRTNTEPERSVYYINSDKKHEIPLRENWEVGPMVIRF
jgi:uncharacterized protein (DUF2141 family)